MRPLDFTLLLMLSLSCCETRVFGQTATPATPTSTAPAAAALLDASLKAMTRRDGVDIQFQQTIFGRSQPVVISGQSLTADSKRTRVELRFKQVERQAQVKLLCDGTTFYRIESVGPDQQIISYTLKDLQDALDKLATNETERVAKEDMEKEQQGMHGFDGIAAMVKDLKSRMNFSEPKPGTMTLTGKPDVAVKIIEGHWTNVVLDMLAPPKQGNDPNQQDRRYLWNEKLSFFLVPRTAKVYFDQTTGQLLRIELLGITEKQGPERTLSLVDITSITPMKSLDSKLFQPTPEELKYKKIPIDLTVMVKQRHMQTMENLKMQQQMQK